MRLVHNLFVGILGLLTCVAFVLTLVVGWTTQMVFVTDNFVGVVADVTSDPRVTEKISDELATQVITALALEQRITDLLPDNLDRLAPRVVEGVQSRLTEAADNLLSGDQFQARWENALTVFHSRLMALLRGDAPNAELVDGTLTIDLLGALGGLITQLQADGVLPTEADLPDFGVIDDRAAFIDRLGAAVQAQLPADFGQVQIANATALERMSTLVQLSDEALVGLALITLVLGVLTVWLAHRNWRALFRITLGIEALLGLALVVLTSVQERAVTVLGTPDGRVVAGAFVARISASLIEWLFITAVIVGVVAVVVWLFGHGERKRANEPAAPVAAPE